MWTVATIHATQSLLASTLQLMVFIGLCDLVFNIMCVADYGNRGAQSARNGPGPKPQYG